jgi:hypothetical protein
MESPKTSMAGARVTASLDWKGILLREFIGLRSTPCVRTRRPHRYEETVIKNIQDFSILVDQEERIVNRPCFPIT